jgi:hypothetical protein
VGILGLLRHDELLSVMEESAFIKVS